MSGVGSLLYLFKHSRPKLSNMVRELSKFIDEANMSHHKALICVIKYVIDNKGYLYQTKQEKISMYHGNYTVIVTQTNQEIITLGKA